MVPLVAALAWPNFKRLVRGGSQLFRTGAKPVEYGTSKIWRYASWVIALTAIYSVYNLAVAGTLHNTEAWQYTGVEFMVSAAGLVTVILEKKARK
jgi:hypothetical protein